jgi:hypothetical protein
METALRQMAEDSMQQTPYSQLCCGAAVTVWLLEQGSTLQQQL